LPRIAQSNFGARPRIFLVDDHRQVLDAVSAMLADDFDVVGVATDGSQALDSARQAEPDVIVLDVEMPGLDGFETLRALREAGLPTTPVVFLSMHEGDDFVGEGFRCGGCGYVSKARVSRDLVSALDQALLGRLFVPSLTSLLHLANGSGHAIQLHRGPESLIDSMAHVFDVALHRGDAACIVATKDIREAVRDRLRARGWNVGGSSGHKRYLDLDATDGLNRFMRNGLPDRDRLSEIITELDQFRLAVAEGTTSHLTIFGNMVVSLCMEGNVKAALAVESLWNTLTTGLPFLTLCGYETSCFHDRVPNLLSDVCVEHWALSHADDV
jgi:DNA-binding NarL/FixJ family response regulator